jgi:hypothetical protein
MAGRADRLIVVVEGVIQPFDADADLRRQLHLRTGAADEARLRGAVAREEALSDARPAEAAGTTRNAARTRAAVAAISAVAADEHAGRAGAFRQPSDARRPINQEIAARIAESCPAAAEPITQRPNAVRVRLQAENRLGPLPVVAGMYAGEQTAPLDLARDDRVGRTVPAVAARLAGARTAAAPTPAGSGHAATAELWISPAADDGAEFRAEVESAPCGRSNCRNGLRLRCQIRAVRRCRGEQAGTHHQADRIASHWRPLPIARSDFTGAHERLARVRWPRQSILIERGIRATITMPDMDTVTCTSPVRPPRPGSRRRQLPATRLPRFEEGCAFLRGRAPSIGTGPATSRGLTAIYAANSAKRAIDGDPTASFRGEDWTTLVPTPAVGQSSGCPFPGQARVCVSQRGALCEPHHRSIEPTSPLSRT